MKTDEQVLLLDNLQSLLENQIAMARRSNFRHVEALAERANAVVEKIVETKTFDHPEFDTQRKHIVKLYKKVQLILAAEKDSVGRQMKKVGNVRKTLRAYRNSG